MGEYLSKTHICIFIAVFNYMLSTLRCWNFCLFILFYFSELLFFLPFCFNVFTVVIKSILQLTT